MPAEVSSQTAETVTNQASEGHVCGNCGISYDTRNGLGQHRRQAHPVEYNDEINVDRMKARWSDEELEIMAGHEVDAVNSGVRFVNQYILGKMPNRSLESIKGARRKANYKEMVAAKMEQSNRPSIGAGTPNENGFNYDESLARYASALTEAIADSITRLQHKRTRYIIELVGIAGNILEGQTDDLQLTNWVLRTCRGNSEAIPNGPNTRRRANPSDRRRGRERVGEYAELQRLYAKDLKAALRRVLEDSRNPVIMPSPDETIAFWRDIYESNVIGTGINNIEELLPPQQNLNELWNPVCVEDIRSCGLDTESAAGPDRVSVTSWLGINIEAKRLFYNLVMYKGRLEVGLNKARTVLIPKKRGTLGPGDFRPLSISSVVIRQLHKIFASRFRNMYKFDQRQKAFIECDGTMENLSILSALLADARSRRREIHIATLDVRKAFDSVSHETVIATMEMIGCPQPFIGYMGGLYQNANTTLQYEGTEAKIKINRGVLQGDPFSPMAFNTVIDRALRGLEEKIGYRMNGRVFNCIAYADDIILMASTKMGLQLSLNQIVSDFSRFGLEVNHDKSNTLSLVPSGREKKVKTLTDPIFRINNVEIRPLGVIDVWRYLGVQFIGSRADSKRISLTDDLLKIDDAPLKPQQRIRMVEVALIPKYLHVLVLGPTTKGRLRDLDSLVRKFVRKWLHLPNDSPLAYFYASVKDGGLGLMNLEEGVPAMKYARLQRFMATDQITNQAFNESNYIKGLIEWCTRALVKFGNNFSTAARTKHWVQELDLRYDTKHLSESKHSKASTAWVKKYADKIRARDYVRYHHLRVGCLPSKARTARGTGRDKGCRAGCQCPETNYHIIQQCHRTHGGRIKRHDRVVDMLTQFLAGSEGVTVVKEPRFRTTDGLKKPDLLVSKDGTTTLLDVQIVSGTNNRRDHREKKAKYQDLEDLKQQIQSRCHTSDVKYEAITIAYKGIMEKQSAKLLEDLKVKNQQQHMICTSVLRGSALNWDWFNRITTMRYA